MSSNLIRDHTSALVEGMLSRARSLQEMKHKLDQGILRELFLKNLLEYFLTDQFSTCSGHIVNSNGMQSCQQDIIIFDNRILPPFILEQNIGCIPAESVLATIEVKSTLEKRGLCRANEKAKKLEALYEGIKTKLESEIDKIEGKVEREECKRIFCMLESYLKPISSIFGLAVEGLPMLNEETKGRNWLDENIQYLKAICVAEKYSWICVNEKWSWRGGDTRFEETKRFIAVLIDNCRTYSEFRKYFYLHTHQDWLSNYIRDL